jgi:hypothetical protein
MLSIVLVLLAVASLAQSRRYHAHDKVSIVANTVGPYNNPTETYPVSENVFRSPEAVVIGCYQRTTSPTALEKISFHFFWSSRRQHDDGATVGQRLF